MPKLNLNKMSFHIFVKNVFRFEFFDRVQLDQLHSFSRIISILCDCRHGGESLGSTAECYC